MNLNEAIQKIKQAGATNARSVPMPNSSVRGGDYQIEICQNGVWAPIVTGVKQPMAESIIAQALNRVILD